MENMNFKKRVLFIGIPDMAYIGLDALFYAGANIVGVMGPFKNHTTYAQFKNYVLSKKLNYIDYDSLDSEELLNTIKDLKIDIAFVFSYNNKIPMKFINLIKDGVLNTHPSLLPNYRGGNPYSRVILNGEKQTGVTIHLMSENFDEGDIVEQVICPLAEQETMGTLFQKTNYIGANLALKTLIEYEKTGLINHTPQPSGKFIYAKNFSQQETWIDYNKSAKYIETLIRSTNPYIPIYTLYKGNAIKLMKANYILEDISSDFANGDIYKIENNKVYIKTSDGGLIPEILQFGGLFIGDCSDFIKYANPQVGESFGR